MEQMQVKKEDFKKLYELFETTHWTKGTYFRHDYTTGKTMYCLMGGIEHVCALHRDDPQTHLYARELVKNMPFEFVAMRLGEQLVYQNFSNMDLLTGPIGVVGSFLHGLVTAYNDMSTTKLDDVLKLIDKTIQSFPDDTITIGDFEAKIDNT